MKLNSNLNTVERSGLAGNEANKFTIEASAKAFEILAANIYSDPRLAVVRELMCNAYDAHVASGVEQTPYRVTVPNEQTPFFEVYDRGPGMTHDQIMNLYTRFFGSTKDQSNDFIGAMGIGSKSPFAYTTQFIVESRQSGQLRSYSAYITEDGSPEIILVETRATDEPDGLTVRVPVKKQDYREFESRILRIAHGFQPSPEILNSNYEKTAEIYHTFVTANGAKVHLQSEKVKYNNNYYTMSGTTRTDLTGSSYTRESIYAVVKQGSVYYPMSIPDAAKSPQLTKFGFKLLKVLADANLVIEVPMGSCQIAASRETLRYDKSTVDYLEKVLVDFAQQVLNSFESVFQDHAKKLPVQLHSEVDQAASRWTWFNRSTNSHSTQALAEYYNTPAQMIGAWYSGGISLNKKDLIDWTSLTFSESSQKSWKVDEPESKVTRKGNPEIITSAESQKINPGGAWTLTLSNFDAVVFNDTLLSDKQVAAHMRVRYAAAVGTFKGLDLKDFNILYLSPLNEQHPDCKLTKAQLLKKFKLVGCDSKVYFVSDLVDRPRRKIERDPATKLPRTIFRDGVYTCDKYGEPQKVVNFDLQANAGALYLPLTDIRGHAFHQDAVTDWKDPTRDFVDRQSLRRYVDNHPTRPMGRLFLVNNEQYVRMGKLQHGLIRVDVWLKEQHRKAWDQHKISMLTLARWVMIRQDSAILEHLFPNDKRFTDRDMLTGLNYALRYAKAVAPMPDYKLPPNVQSFFDRATEFNQAHDEAVAAFRNIEATATGLNPDQSPETSRTLKFLVKSVFTEQELAALRKAVQQVILSTEKSYDMLKASKYRFIADGWVQIPTSASVFTMEWFPSIFNNCKKGTSNV